MDRSFKTGLQHRATGAGQAEDGTKIWKTPEEFQPCWRWRLDRVAWPQRVSWEGELGEGGQGSE